MRLLGGEVSIFKLVKKSRIFQKVLIGAEMGRRWSKDNKGRRDTRFSKKSKIISRVSAGQSVSQSDRLNDTE